MEKLEGLPESKLVNTQKITKTYHNKDGSRLRVNMRYDDQCGNKHNSFSITGNWWEKGTSSGEPNSGGCLHDDIYEYAEDLRKYIKFHLCTSDGPSAYVSNATYCAGNRDYNGRAPGDISGYAYGIRFNGSVISHFIDDKLWTYLKNAIESGVSEFNLKTIEYLNRPNENYDLTPNYSINNFADNWYGCPFKKGSAQARELCIGLTNEPVAFVKLPTEYSKGKLREFDLARSCAIWPEATDEQLSLPKEELEILLIDRLPNLMIEFKDAIEELGFEY